MFPSSYRNNVNIRKVENCKQFTGIQWVSFFDYPIAAVVRGFTVLSYSFSDDENFILAYIATPIHLSIYLTFLIPIANL